MQVIDTLLKRLLLSYTDKSGIVDKKNTPKESGKKILKKTIETIMQNLHKNPLVRQDFVNRIDEEKGKELSRIQKLNDYLFLTRRYLNDLNRK